MRHACRAFCGLSSLKPTLRLSTPLSCLLPLPSAPLTSADRGNTFTTTHEDKAKSDWTDKVP